MRAKSDPAIAVIIVLSRLGHLFISISVFMISLLMFIAYFLVFFAHLHNKIIFLIAGPFILFLSLSSLILCIRRYLVFQDYYWRIVHFNTYRKKLIEKWGEEWKG